MENKDYYLKQQKDKNENRFYVYVHRRITDNKPFYVGKGSGGRAWDTSSRNPHWENVSKKHGFVIDIVFDNLNEDTAFQCEVDTILEYEYMGYPLVNMTKGGEGVSGLSQTDEHKRKILETRKTSKAWIEGHKSRAEKLTGRPRSQEVRDHLSSVLRKSEKLKSHLAKQTEKNRDANTYKFYHYNGEMFEGTRLEFSDYTGMTDKKIGKLFINTSEKRSVVGNWSLEPINMKNNIPSHYKATPASKVPNPDLTEYQFYHVSGESFYGTRLELSALTNIPYKRITALFHKNPSSTVYGWSLSPVDWDNYCTRS